MEYKYDPVHIFPGICLIDCCVFIVWLANKLIKLTNIKYKILGGCSPMVGRQFVALKVVGSSPTIHPLDKVTFFKKNKIKKGVFKKKHHLINLISSSVFRKKMFNNIHYNKLYKKVHKGGVYPTRHTKKYYGCFLTQKFNNPKVVIYINKNVNTFSVGSIIKYFKIKHSKYVRRGPRGLKIFLNFLKNVFQKKYTIKSPQYILYSISGFDYSLIASRKNIKSIFKNSILVNEMYFLCNLKISFTKGKNKKIKSIKKRLKKKILLNFLKKTNL